MAVLKNSSFKLNCIGLLFHEKHRLLITALQWTEFLAAFAVSFQIMFCAFDSASLSCLQVFLFCSLFLLPCGFYDKAWCVVLDVQFLRLMIDVAFLNKKKMMCFFLPFLPILVFTTLRQHVWQTSHVFMTLKKEFNYNLKRCMLICFRKKFKLNY